MRRKKPRVVWLPQDLDNRLNVAPATATAPNDSATIIKIFTGNPLGDIAATEEIPIVKDFAGGVQGIIADAATTLADLESSGYRLRRIVGKLGFSCLQDTAIVAGGPSIFHVTAGFIIRDVDENGNSFVADAGGVNASPATLSNTRDPWIWRRSWDIANTTSQALATDPNVAAFAPSNYSFAGTYDGPHVDAKTARIVGTEQRLFLSVTVEGVNGAAQSPPGAILLLGDLRVLASMRSTSGNRRNASR